MELGSDIFTVCNSGKRIGKHGQSLEVGINYFLYVVSSHTRRASTVELQEAPLTALLELMHCPVLPESCCQ